MSVAAATATAMMPTLMVAREGVAVAERVPAPAMRIPATQVGGSPALASLSAAAAPPA